MANYTFYNKSLPDDLRVPLKQHKDYWEDRLKFPKNNSFFCGITNFISANMMEIILQSLFPSSFLEQLPTA